MGVFQYSNPISGDRVAQCEIFQKVERFQKKNLLLNTSGARNLFLLKISLTLVIPALCHSL